MEANYLSIRKFSEFSAYLDNFHEETNALDYYCSEYVNIFDFVYFNMEWETNKDRESCIKKIELSEVQIIQNIRNSVEFRKKPKGKKAKTNVSKNSTNTIDLDKEITAICEALIKFKCMLHRSNYEEFNKNLLTDETVRQLHLFPKDDEMDAFVERFRFLDTKSFVGKYTENFFKLKIYKPLRIRKVYRGFNYDLFADLVFDELVLNEEGDPKTEINALNKLSLDRMQSASLAVVLLRIYRQRFQKPGSNLPIPDNLGNIYLHIKEEDGKSLLVEMYMMLWETLTNVNKTENKEVADAAGDTFADNFCALLFSKSLFFSKITPDMFKAMVFIVNYAFIRICLDAADPLKKSIFYLIMKMFLSSVFAVKLEEEKFKIKPTEPLTFRDEKYTFLLSVFDETCKLQEDFPIDDASILFELLAYSVIRSPSTASNERARTLMHMIYEQMSDANNTRSLSMYLFYIHLGSKSNITNWDKTSEYMYVELCMRTSVTSALKDKTEDMIPKILKCVNNKGELIAANLRYGCENLLVQFNEVLIEEDNLR